MKRFLKVDLIGLLIVGIFTIFTSCSSDSDENGNIPDDKDGYNMEGTILLTMDGQTYSKVEMKSLKNDKEFYLEGNLENDFNIIMNFHQDGTFGWLHIHENYNPIDLNSGIIYYTPRDFINYYLDFDIISDQNNTIKAQLIGVVSQNPFQFTEETSETIKLEIDMKYAINEFALNGYFTCDINGVFSRGVINGSSGISETISEQNSIFNTGYRIDYKYPNSGIVTGSIDFGPTNNHGLTVQRFDVVSMSYIMYETSGVINYSEAAYSDSNFNYTATFEATATNPDDFTDVISITDGKMRQITFGVPK